MTYPLSSWLISVGPALVVTATFVVGFLVFVARSLVRGIDRDTEHEARGRSILVGRFLRAFIVWFTRPIFRAVVASRISPIAVTAAAAVLALGAGIAIALGHLALGGWLFIFSGILDIFDGRLARARGEVSVQGEVVDSVMDRYSDAAVLVGLAWFYRETWVLLLVLAALVGTALVPYIRAKGDAFGIAIRGGLMQRPERIVYLGGSMGLTPLFDTLFFPDAIQPVHWLAVGGVGLVAVLSNLTAIGRFVTLLRSVPFTPRSTPTRHGGPGRA